MVEFELNQGMDAMLKKLLVLSIFPLVLSGCFRPSAEQLASADYGQYPSDYEQTIKSYMAQRLKDPYSAQYQFLSQPRTAWNGIGGLKYGYAVCVLINAKNSFGGYTGSQLSYFMLRGNTIIDSQHGTDEYSAAMAKGKCDKL
jgi:hypothetical protein